MKLNDTALLRANQFSNTKQWTPQLTTTGIILNQALQLLANLGHLGAKLREKQRIVFSHPTLYNTPPTENMNQFFYFPSPSTLVGNHLH